MARDICRVCHKPIHPERLLALPNTKVCSKKCSKERTRQLGLRAAKERREALKREHSKD